MSTQIRSSEVFIEAVLDAVREAVQEAVLGHILSPSITWQALAKLCAELVLIKEWQGEEPFHFLGTIHWRICSSNLSRSFL